jgi:hypothetical protein
MYEDAGGNASMSSCCQASLHRFLLDLC